MSELLSENRNEDKSNDLTSISHKDFNEFIKGKGFVGRNNYKLTVSTLQFRKTF